MGCIMTYSEKLKDPRWQRKRLEIMQRDKFTCQRCYDSETTLHVHHRNYTYGKEPWEYESNELVTLCSECHENETAAASGLESHLKQLKTFMFAEDLNEIIEKIGLCWNKFEIPSDVFAASFECECDLDLMLQKGKK